MNGIIGSTAGKAREERLGVLSDGRDCCRRWIKEDVDGDADVDTEARRPASIGDELGLDLLLPAEDGSNNGINPVIAAFAECVWLRCGDEPVVLGLA